MQHYKKFVKYLSENSDVLSLSSDKYDYRPLVSKIHESQKFIIKTSDFRDEIESDNLHNFLYGNDEDIALPFEKIWIEFIGLANHPLKGLLIGETTPGYFVAIGITTQIMGLPESLKVAGFHGSLEDFKGALKTIREKIEKNMGETRLKASAQQLQRHFVPFMIGIILTLRIFAKNSTYITAYEDCDHTFMTRNENGKKIPHKINRIIHIYKKNSVQKPKPLYSGKMDFTHRWLVRGHWRKCQTLGKNREGKYEVHGFTWVVPHEKGEGELIADKVRIIHESHA